MPPLTKTSDISDSLRNFDSLPDAAYVRQPVVQALYACSSSTLWRMLRKNLIPQPRRFSARVTAWNVGGLRKSLALSGPGGGCEQ